MPRIRLNKWGSLLWIPFAFALSFSVYFVVKWGLKPKPIPEFNPTKFESMEQIGAVAYRRLRAALMQEKLLVIGSNPWLRDYEKVWNGLIAAAREDKWNIDVLYEDQALAAIQNFSGLKRQQLSLPDISNPMTQELKSHLMYKHILVVHTTFNHSAIKGEGSWRAEIEGVLKRPWTTVTMLGFGTNEAEIEALQPACIDHLEPATKEQYLACSAVKISRQYLRKKLSTTDYWAAMQRHGLKDHYLFVHYPAMATPAAVEE